jgi:hypothetical protein
MAQVERSAAARRTHVDVPRRTISIRGRFYLGVVDRYLNGYFCGVPMSTGPPGLGKGIRLAVEADVSGRLPPPGTGGSPRASIPTQPLADRRGGRGWCTGRPAWLPGPRARSTRSAPRPGAAYPDSGRVDVARSARHGLVQISNESEEPRRRP